VTILGGLVVGLFFPSQEVGLLCFLPKKTATFFGSGFFGSPYWPDSTTGFVFFVFYCVPVWGRLLFTGTSTLVVMGQSPNTLFFALLNFAFFVPLGPVFFFFPGVFRVRIEFFPLRPWPVRFLFCLIPPTLWFSRGPNPPIIFFCTPQNGAWFFLQVPAVFFFHLCIRGPKHMHLHSCWSPGPT